MFARLLLLLFFFPILAFSQKGRKIHYKSLLVDTHNDVLTTIVTEGVNLENDLTGTTHSDLARFKKGGVDVQFFSVWCDGKVENPFNLANREIDSLYALASRNTHRMEIAYSASDARRISRDGKLAAMIGVEGGHMIENDLSKLDSLFRRGARYLTLTWNNSTSWATSAMDETNKKDSIKQKGLTEFGKQVIRRMNELGMMVDVSHGGEQTLWDALITSSRPVIASHSCAHALCPVFRNLKDEQIKAIARNNGVICLNFFSGFIDSNFFKRNAEFNERHKHERDSLIKTVTDPYFADTYLFSKYADEVAMLRPPLSMLMDHLDHIVKLVGVDHVGMGSDFDGINSLPKELEGVQDFPKITDMLIERGYTKRQIKKILGGNVFRVMKANERKSK